MDYVVVLACVSVLWTSTPGLQARTEIPDVVHRAVASDTVPIASPGAPQTEPAADSVVGPILLPVSIGRWDPDTAQRRRAVTLSDAYMKRLTVHRYGSYLMLPLFAGQYILGQKLLSQKDGVFDGTRRVPIDARLRDTHRTVAYGVATLFAVNTTTGLWNLWEARHDGSHSGRRTVHVLSMLGADAGFIATGLMAGRAVDRRPSDARAHRNVALASIGLATFGATVMWF